MRLEITLKATIDGMCKKGRIRRTRVNRKSQYFSFYVIIILQETDEASNTSITILVRANPSFSVASNQR